MPNRKTMKSWWYYLFGLTAVVVYFCLTFFAPQNTAANALGLTQTQIFFLKFTIVLPYAATWSFAVYGLATLEKYIIAMNKKSDSAIQLLKSFRTGLIWIVLSTILVALIGGLRPYFVENPSSIPIFTIVTNYLYVFPPLVGFIIIFRGVLMLRSSQEMAENKRKTGYPFNTALVLLISAFYIFLIFTNPTRQSSTDPAITATYYLPDIITLLTIVLPILATWWIGFFVAFATSDLIPYLPRSEYFKGITRILYGIWSIIFTSIIIQALLSLGGTRLYAIGLGILLLIIYIFIILQGVGYFFIALGSNTLRRSLKETDNG
jgi:hypothetical protein